MKVSQNIMVRSDSCVARIQRKYGVPPLLVPFEYELNGLKRISMGVQILFDQIRDRDWRALETYTKTTIGLGLVATGVYQLAGPLLLGFTAYKYYNS